jgi:hypothetical protein
MRKIPRGISKRQGTRLAAHSSERAVSDILPTHSPVQYVLYVRTERKYSRDGISKREIEMVWDGERYRNKTEMPYRS